ncbi:zinc-dependent metalloprotease [Reichenbachiella versicolor]|uniref:zinc-dependent metalloprotease n=1 Tax=Reichenbachiella versicolor TaxID=1821036 RepID=UPI000D6E164C|nr:zinc-dependent metalloprotease [Reichenbachiella versicolor]
MRSYLRCWVVLFFLLFAYDGYSQAKEEKDTTSVDSTSDEFSYKKLMDEGQVKKGLFSVYQLKEDIYFEIPDSLLAQDILIVNKISSVPHALNGHGLNKGMAYENKLIRFYKDTLMKKVWVKTLNPAVKSPEEDLITLSVKKNYSESVIEEFEIACQNDDSTSVVIKVNKVFDGREKSFTDLLSSTGLGGSIKSKLSKIESVKSFPENVVVKSLMTTSVTEGGGPAMPLTIGITVNIVRLPSQIMKPRFADDRIGYFSIPMDYFSDEQHSVENRRLLTRWRLEPREEDIEKYKAGQLVEPKKPIVYYIDPATPSNWKSYIKKGVLDWNLAFEEAGFKNAIQVKIPDVDDQDFDIDDVRYSVITYAASNQQNAMGPSIIDPRSGEILEADIIWWHNVMKTLHKWIRIQTGPIDPNARANKFSDEYMGEAIRFVSSHEVGHTFGLAHNMGASYSYPVDSLRSPTFTEKMAGTSASIMDYARYNYVAQPGDSIKELHPEIGVYDLYAIAWGYRWLDTKTPQEEVDVLNQWLRAHEDDPLYFYGPQQGNGIIDPRAQSEDLGNDAVLASQYGLLNLKRIVPEIINWTEEEGKSYYEASKLYKGVIDQWLLYTGHVMANIGGVYLNNSVYGDGKDSYVPVPTEIQEKSLKYLIDNAVLPQNWLFTPELINKVYAVRDAPDGKRYYSPVSLMRAYQEEVMYSLLKTNRMMRLVDNQVLYKEGQKVFTAHDIYDALFEAVFKNPSQHSLSIYERMTQKNYVDVLTIDRIKLLKKTHEKTLSCSHRHFKNVHYSYIPRVSDEASGKRAELERVMKFLEKNKKKGDRATREHYGDLLARIKYNLEK